MSEGTDEDNGRVELSVIDGGALPEATKAEAARRQGLNAALERHTIIQLAAAGLKPFSIARRLAKGVGDPEAGPGGYLKPTLRTENEIQKVIDDFMERTAEQDADAVKKLRAIENRRLDLLLEKLESGIEEGLPSAIRTGLAIVDRRAKLNGLDAPKRVEHSGQIDHTLVDREEVEREAEAFRTQHETPVLEGSGTEIP